MKNRRGKRLLYKSVTNIKPKSFKRFLLKVLKLFSRN